jgi:hypothetical protein
MKNWQARVEWAGPRLTDEQTDALVSELAAHRHHPAVGGELDGHGSATISVLEVGTLRQAIAAAIAAVENAGRKIGIPITATGVEILDEDTAHARLEVPLIPPLVGYKEIADMAGVSRQRAQQLGQIDGFPAAVITAGGGPLRSRQAVESWLQRWDRRPGPKSQKA